MNPLNSIPHFLGEYTIKSIIKQSVHIIINERWKNMVENNQGNVQKFCKQIGDI